MMRANLWLRTASRVIARVAEFRATAFYELEKQARRIDWNAWLGDGVAPEFRVTAKKSKLFHSDAIAERLLRACDPSRATLGMTRQLFIVRVHRDMFTISADTSGELLHMRGYRQAVGKAPLRETIAAAMLIASDWTGDDALLDPMCGSGTIPIEAALIASHTAPGLLREFAFERWPSFHQATWDGLRAEALHRITPVEISIRGSDRDAGAIEAARANAERAAISASLLFEVKAMSAVHASDITGLIATNPPYGKRVSEGKDIRNLYAELGKLMRGKFADWRLTLLSPEDRLTAQIGIPLERLAKTTNGGIRVSLLSSARFLHSE